MTDLDLEARKEIVLTLLESFFKEMGFGREAIITVDPTIEGIVIILSPSIVCGSNLGDQINSQSSEYDTIESVACLMSWDLLAHLARKENLEKRSPKLYQQILKAQDNLHRDQDSYYN